MQLEDYGFCPIGEGGPFVADGNIRYGTGSIPVNTHGGNLSEALGNLSKVLRDRKKMAEKIQAMSMEAKASAGIIGSLPPIVMLLVYLTTPDYISLLWTHPTGQLMLVGCVIWMSIGIFVMKKMINFDF